MEFEKAMQDVTILYCERDMHEMMSEKKVHDENRVRYQRIIHAMILEPLCRNSSLSSKRRMFLCL